MADLLAELRAERAKYDLARLAFGGDPGPTVRALDCAIVLAEASLALQAYHVDEGGTKVVRDAWGAASAAWKGEPRG